MNKYLQILISLTVFFTACSKDESDDTRFSILNNSDKNIEFVYIATVFYGSKSVDYKIDKQKEITFGYNLDDKGDGALNISYKFVNSDDTLVKSLGYYSNGYIFEKKWTIAIYADFIQVKTEYKDY